MTADGESASAVRDAANTAIKRAQSDRAVASSASKEMLVTIAGVLHAWHHELRYLTTSGRPRALPIKSGRLSLVGMLKSNGAELDSTLAISTMMRLKLLKRTRSGMVVPAQSMARLRTIDPMVADHVCSTVSRMLSTVLSNTSDSELNGSYIERSAEVSDLPASALPEFRAFAHAQSEQLIENVNHWLESRRMSGRGAQLESVSRVSAGVHVFAFVD